MPSDATRAGHAGAPGGHEGSPLGPPPLAWSQPQRAARGDDQASFERAGALRWSLVVLAALLGAGAVAGLAWSVLAEPPGFTVTPRGAVMGETAAGRAFGVEVVYALLAAALGSVVGAVAGVRLARYSWVLALVLMAGALGSAAVSLGLGRLLGPGDPVAAVQAAGPGAVVATQLDISAPGLLLTWPAASLAGYLAAVALSTRTRR